MTNTPIVHLLLLFCFLLPPASGQAQQQNSALTIDQIMEGPGFIGHLPENLRWADDSKTLYFDWNPKGDAVPFTYAVAMGNNPAPRLLSEEEAANLMAGRGIYNKARTLKIYNQQGDLYLKDVLKGTLTQITQTTEAESALGFSADENRIFYQQGSNLFAWNRLNGTLSQLTNFQQGADRKPTAPTEADSWLEKDQLAIFDVLAHRKRQEDARKEFADARRAKRLKAIYTGQNRLSNLRISPDGRFVTYWLTPTGTEPKRTDVPDFVTRSGYTQNLNARPKVGNDQAAPAFWIYDSQADTTFQLDRTQIPGIYDKPDFLKDYQPDSVFRKPYTKPREVVVHGPFYSETGLAVVVIRSADNKDRWIMRLAPETGALTLLDRQRDEAWIAGPGIGWNFSAGNTGWMPDGKSFWFHAEHTGFSHLYAVNAETGVRRALTQGSFEILEASLSADQKFFYIVSNREHPGEHHFYRLPVGGGTMEKLTGPAGGRDELSISPDEKHVAFRYSTGNQPWEVHLMALRPGAPERPLTDSRTEAFRRYNWRMPEIVTFTAQDGATVYARLYRPANPQPGGKAAIFVHGAGYLQNVHKWWSTYSREYMFHNLLADQGYTVLDIDYRGSAGYGRNWRTGIYRYMGGKDLSDHVDGARYLAAAHGVSPSRIGIYGGSYGGFITLMGMFTQPGVFKAGAALRSVTDWAHYNHPYTSNILNTPAEDSIAYRRSSPIYHANGLKDALLILHGMVDTNVHFQDVVRLSQRLIELKKENWEMAVYPMEDHGFVEPSSWADEYKRIYKLFEEQLKE